MPTELPKILLDHMQTPTKRMLVMDSEGFRVLSECCARRLVQTVEGYYECSSCGKALGGTDEGFRASITFEEVLQYKWDDGWSGWLECFFGIEGGEISFEWSDES